MNHTANHDTDCNPDAAAKGMRVSLLAVGRLMIPLAMLAWGIYVQRSNYALMTNHESISAELASAPLKQLKINRSPEKADSLYNDYLVDYRFSVDGKTYTGHASVATAPIGPWIRVYYEIGNPANNRTHIPGSNEGGIWICLALLIGIVMCPFFWREPKHF